MAKQRLKFEVIKETIDDESNRIPICKLCKLAKVSRSGYYKWLNTADKRKELEERDCQDVELIKEALKKIAPYKGVKSIYNQLLREGIVMNIKKITRLRKKFGLK